MKPAYAKPREFSPGWAAAGLQNGRTLSGRGGFTLVELLVVISILAVVAGLVVGVSGVAARKSKEGRVQSDLNRLVTAIESYKARHGFYPPCNENGMTPGFDGVLRPSIPNQLFYELSGMVFTNPPANPSAGWFYLLGRDGRLPENQFHVANVLQVFGVDGFANSARNRRDVKFKTEFKSSDVARIQVPASGQLIEVLVVPVPPPRSSLPNGPYTVTATTGARYYPWFYDSVSTNRINTDSFDLWTEVEIGNKIIRFSNWEPGPVVIGP